ncbi:MAG: hypothetical protein KDK90_15125 [Leptospiraceae bacterium]|nr:hypothetical protein [Leptospiraceae bacterium]
MKNSDQHHITTIKELWEKQEFQLSIPVIDLQHLWLIWLLLELDEVVSRGQPEEIDSKFQTISPELIIQLIIFLWKKTS